MLKIYSSGLKVWFGKPTQFRLAFAPVIRNGETLKVLGFLEKGNRIHITTGNIGSRKTRNGSDRRTDRSSRGTESLVRLAGKAASFREKKMLERAKFLLVSELATARTPPPKQWKTP